MTEHPLRPAILWRKGSYGTQLLTFETVGGHGRIETCTACVISDPDVIA